jgi:hypothetical protein
MIPISMKIGEYSFEDQNLPRAAVRYKNKRSARKAPN